MTAVFRQVRKASSDVLRLFFIRKNERMTTVRQTKKGKRFYIMTSREE
ncbi:hypothetical protein D2M30_4231 [Bacillus amyloliquefaciens]|nr:hypothetical protein B425_4052 [Bacillus amyloliquefaciens]QBG58526.1 hypothetical protein D2M30_4231 [Bacillus amyloliquefaciens]